MVDFPSLPFDLGEEIDMLRDTVRNFAAIEIAPRAFEIRRMLIGRDLFGETR